MLEPRKLAGLLALVLLIAPCSSYKLLFYPLSEKTHMIVHLKLAVELAKRNNTVYLLTAECHQPFAERVAAQMAPDVKLHFISYWLNCTSMEEEKKASQLVNPISACKAILANVFGRADQVLSNNTLLAELQQLAPSIDLMVNDILSYGMLVASKLGLQYVDVDVGTAGALWESIFYGAEPATSFIPAVGTFFATDGMNFWQRVVNLAVTKVTRGFVQYAYWHPKAWLQTIIAKHNLPMRWPYVHYMLLLTNSNFITEAPRALAPNTKYIGPILPEPAQPLPAELYQWVEGSGQKGTVFVSFGGTLEAPLAASRTLVHAMNAMPDVRFVWKLSHEEQAALAVELVSLKNAYISDWVPQNNLLGHPKVRAFVTQGGYLSMGEAAYHAVPILGMPFIPGQGEQIRFAQDQGRARRIPADTLLKGNAAAFQEALEGILTDNSYKKAAEIISKRLKATPRPYKEIAADWVEYAAAVKEHGPFLNTQKQHQWWYQQVMLDVLLFYIAVVAVPVILVSRFVWHKLWLLQWQLAGKIPSPTVIAEITLQPRAVPKKAE